MASTRRSRLQAAGLCLGGPAGAIGVPLPSAPR